MPSRQEVLNVILAQLLQELGFVSAPEQILRQPSRSVNLPDVIVDLHGLRLVIECEFARRSQRSARQAAYRKARERVENAISHIGVAVVYPARLRRVSFERAKEELSTSELEYTVMTEASLFPLGQIELFPSEGVPTFSRGTVNDLGDTLRRSYEQMVRDETVDTAVARLEEGIEACLGTLRIQPATSIRMAEVLGIHDLESSETQLNSQQCNATNRISALIIVNAMMFQEVLSQSESRAVPLGRFSNRPRLKENLQEHWQFILNEINYHPIFYTATELLGCFSSDISVHQSLDQLMRTATDIITWRVSLRHDLAGRIYHRILEESKYLGAYYTSIPAATLLLKLALQANNYDVDWSNEHSISELKIADLACGTGTLLMASADCVVDNYVRACAGRGIRPVLDSIHELLISDILHGWDVLPSAIHLTASTLSLRIPDRPVRTTNLCRVLHGGPNSMLGSLEALEHEGVIGTLFSQPAQIEGTGDVSQSTVRIPPLDLCVMNPPFTSSRRGNRLFGSVPDVERQRMQRKLRRIVNEQDLSANVTAGLGSVFVALADRYLKPGGHLALVLPRSMISGVAWKKSRELLANEYILKYLVASHEPSHWNFSENTSLSETLLIARKMNNSEVGTDEKVRCINLWRQPRNAIEGLTLANEAREQNATDLESNRGISQLRIGGRKYGEMFEISRSILGPELMKLSCSFAQGDLVRVLYRLINGDLYLPGQGVEGRLPLCPLRELATLGPDPRDVYDGFNLSEDAITQYPALWGHDASSIQTMKVSPNMHLTPLSEPLPGRNLRRVEDLWPRAGKIMVAQRIRLNTKRLTAVRMRRKALADVWWPLSLLSSLRNQNDIEKALVLWFNSTLGLIFLIGMREETEGAWVQYKKPILLSMPVLDVRELGSTKLQALSEVYDALSNRTLKVIPELHTDETRREIDTAFCQILEIPDISTLREIVAREPILCQSLEHLCPDYR